MKSLTIIAIALFFASFLGMYLYASGNPGVEFEPFYAFIPGDGLSAFNAFFFVFLLSLLLFGVGSLVAMIVEGFKYGYLLHASIAGVAVGFHMFDLLFIIPQLMACVAATTLAAGLVLDYRGKTSLFPYWNYSVRYFAFGFIATLLLVFLRPIVVAL